MISFLVIFFQGSCARKRWKHQECSVIISGSDTPKVEYMRIWRACWKRTQVLRLLFRLRDSEMWQQYWAFHASFYGAHLDNFLLWRHWHVFGSYIEPKEKSSHLFLLRSFHFFFWDTYTPLVFTYSFLWTMSLKQEHFMFSHLKLWLNVCLQWCGLTAIQNSPSIYQGCQKGCLQVDTLVNVAEAGVHH